jgi:hypothetical protein
MFKKFIFAVLFLAPGLASAASTRLVQISTNTLTRQSGSIYVAGVDASSATISSGTVTNLTGTNVGISSMTTTLPMSNRKITGLANGTVSTDAAAFGQLSTAVFAVVCTSTTVTSVNNTITTFIPSALGCSGALSVASHHFLILANPYLAASGSTSGNAFTAGLYEDGSGLDNGVYGQCDLQNVATGQGLIGIHCPIIGYVTPGDTSSHAFRIYFSAASGVGTASLGNGNITMRMIVFEVP